MSETKLCKDCRWFKPRWWGAQCTCPAVEQRGAFYLVHGKPERPTPCQDARQIIPGWCGQDGRHWEPTP